MAGGQAFTKRILPGSTLVHLDPPSVNQVPKEKTQKSTGGNENSAKKVGHSLLTEEAGL